MISDVLERLRDRASHRFAAVALAAAALCGGALAGCGGGGGGTTATQPTTTAAGGSGTTTAAQGTTTGTGSGNTFGGGAANGHTVSDVLNAVLTSGDPSRACGTDFVTQRYLSSAYGGEQGCVNAQTSGSAAEAVQIQGLANGSKPGTASVKVVPKGGVYDGEKLTVTLVREGQDWKIDGVKSNAPVGP